MSLLLLIDAPLLSYAQSQYLDAVTPHLMRMSSVRRYWQHRAVYKVRCR